ncbi:hypothetical protein WMF45_32020 [Sorangium sp. So ce448]|uniref:hypothetical protein n=1 Tax=Sorangium sp. So ce448 TaxID=3133314 RepID=UPI003F5F921E
MRAPHALDLDVARVQKPHFGAQKPHLAAQKPHLAAQKPHFRVERGEPLVDQASCSAIERDVVRGVHARELRAPLAPSIERGC